MTYPNYRHRYLPAMTLSELEALPNKHLTPVVIGTGSIEQHGRHLPVAVDALLAEVGLERSIALLDPDVKLLVGPTITYGKSNEHIGFPGTVYISKESLRNQLFAIARQLNVLGFKVLAVYNTHGGNVAVLNYTLREIQAELGMAVGLIRQSADLGLSEQESSYGFHAGEVETSWMLDIWSDAVDMSQAVCEYPAKIDDPGELRPEDAPAIFSWVSSDLSESGVMGDATAATEEKGKLWMDAVCHSLAGTFVRLEKWTEKHFG